MIVVRKGALLLVVVAIVVSFAGCKNESRGCTTEFPPAVDLRVFDFDTGLPVCNYEYTVSGSVALTEQSYGEGDQCNRSAIFLAEGIYVVSVSRDGYEAFVSDSLLITKGECHINTEVLDVDLRHL